MKKVLIPLGIVVIALSIVAYAAAISGTQVQQGEQKNAEKQILVDGDMEASGVGVWSPYHMTITKSAGAVNDGAQILRTAWDGVDSGLARQTILTVGKTYRVTGWARSGGDSIPKIYVLGTRWTGTTSTEWQPIDVIFTSKHADFALLVQNVVGYVEWDDVMVTEYIAPQTNAEKQIVTDGDMEASDAGAWGSADVTLSKEGGLGAGGDGTLVLRLTATGASPRCYQDILNGSATYRVRGWARGDGTNYPRVGVGEAETWTGTTSTEWQYFDVRQDGGNGYFYLRTVLPSTGYVEFDDVFVTEYVGTVTMREKQIVTNGDFEDGTTGWNATSDAVLTERSGVRTGGDGSKYLRVTIAISDAWGTAQKPAVLTIGAQYRITGWTRGDGTNGAPRLNDGVTTFKAFGTSNTWKRFDEVFTATGAVLNLATSGDNATEDYTEWDDVFVTAL
jgi:hypothetical protein